MKENKGFSLVELLVAISIAAVIAGSIGSLLVMSLRMYGKETTDVSLQQELQVTLNQIVDYAMESQTVVLKNTGTDTDYLALGTVSGDDLNAQVFWKEGNRLYLCKDTISGFRAEGATPLDTSVETIISNAGASPTQYLLAEYVDKFSVTLDAASLDNASATFENPLSLNISLGFSRDNAGKVISKNVSDKATLRNRVKDTIYIDGTPYSEKSEVALNTVTEDVEFEENMGLIKIDPDDMPVPKQDLDILEIVPDYSYDYVQFVLGGKDGSLMNETNTNYGSHATISPVTSEELEAYVIRTTGYKNNSNTILSETSYYPNVNASLPAVHFLDNADRVGYYEYVGADNGGFYAINSYESELRIAENPGYGDSKPNIVTFTKNSGDVKNYTPFKYTPVFEYRSYDDGSDDYYLPREVSGRNDYKKVVEHIVESEWYSHDEFKYYEYVGDGNGDVSLEFYRYNDSQSASYSANGGYGCEYKVAGDKYSYFNAEGGEYCAYFDGWQTRDTSTAGYEAGFDYNQIVTDVVMFSKYFPNTPTQSTDYGWKWVEADNGSDLYNNITNGSLRTSANVITSGIYVSATTDSNKRIYLKNHTKQKLINNEVFKLFTMQDVIEGYTPSTPHMLDIRNGLYNRSAGSYVDVNLNALRAWEDAGHKVSLRVRTPEDLSIADIEACDMIVVGEPGDGGFKFANTWINGIKNISGSGSFGMSNDITFPQAVAIYKKVISEEASIAVPSAMSTYGGGFGTSNLSKLFEMLFCFSNADIEREAVIDSTIKAAKEEKIKVQGSVNYWTVDPSYQSGLENRVITSGSGREIFSDYLKSMSNDALSKSLYEDETQVLKAKTTDIVYIGESGSDAGKIIVPSKNENIDGYDFKYTGYTISNWQGGGGGKDTLNPIESNLMLENKNKYLIDRYRIAYNGYDKNNTYVYNEDYGHLYKFYFEGSNEGIYRNQLIYNNDSPLLTFNKTGGTGSLALQTIKQNTHSTTKATQGDIIGTMEFVGADGTARADARRASQGNESSDTYEDSNVEYEMNVYKLANGIDKKVLYMTEAQFKRAQDEGLYLYVLIKTSKDSSNYNKCVIRYTTNEGDPGRVDYDNNQYSADNVDDNENVIKYKAGSGDNESFVREYRYHVHPWYFCNVTPAYNKGNNLFLAKIDAGGGKKYNGSDELYIFIRDTFDLD